MSRCPARCLARTRAGKGSRQLLACCIALETRALYRMPGRLRNSFRSGNLAKHLGLLLLKGIAAVADVARPEDIGLDAIATLLRRDKDGNCYAEDSFLVQLKAASVTSVQYKGHELEWFVS